MKLSEQMRKWNDAVETADWHLNFTMDSAEPQELFNALQDIGRLGAARLLRVAGEPLGYFRARTDFPVDKKQRDMVKTKTAVRKQQQRKAKK